MKTNKKISSAVIKRLPRYRRYLAELNKKDVAKISSSELSHLMEYTASQIRQDLNNFGGFGQQGYGYNVEALLGEISSILGLDREHTMVIVGAGKLGTAVANYIYGKVGFSLKALFDNNKFKIGTSSNGIEILDYETLVPYIEANKIDIGVICSQQESAQEIADKMVFAGVQGIWNFAVLDLEVPDRVAVENVHLSDSLHSLAYHINTVHRQEAKEEKTK
ncbi:MAG: redox-sensing transcriptional repressor Rex [Anaerovoracaceae bacterium]|jgi:redox-sensing transcriptional repressor|nr:redox-sensing transcriptional repressor Rex [Anaerovoracaceae bacterium]